MEWGPIVLSIRLAVVTTLILYGIGIPLAYWLAYGRARWKVIVEVLVAMPLMLPPTVLGFYLLVLLGRTSPIGRLLETLLHVRLVFTFTGLVVASVIYSLPLMVQTLTGGFASLPSTLMDAAATLGKSRWVTLLRVQLPNMKAALLTGGVLSFAHTIGAFGVVLMVGGNIPGETRVAAIVVYDLVQALDYSRANMYAAVLFAISFGILLVVYWLNRRWRLV